MSENDTGDHGLQIRTGQPLRVAVYERIAAGIRQGRYGLGSLLPSDAEVSASLGVSRTVVREAFLLLQEDGLIRTRRGVGRFVAEALPSAGLERLRPWEELLSDDGGPVEVMRIAERDEEATDFVASGLGLTPGGPVRATESLLRRAGGAPLCLSFEYLPTGSSLDRGDPHATVLAALLPVLPGAQLRGSLEISAGVAGPTRSRQLTIAADAAVLVITQRVRVGENAVYLAKHVIAPVVSGITFAQSSGV